MQAGGLVTKLPGEACPSPEGSKACQKENDVSSVAVVEKEDVLKSKFYQSKDLPSGMKLKKKVSDTEENIPKVNGVEKLQENVKYLSDQMPGEAERIFFTPSTKSVRAEKVSATTKNLQKDSDLKKPTDAKTSDLTCDLELTNPTIDKTLNKSSPSSFTQASKDSITSGHTSDKPSQSTDSHLSKKCQDDDDDVVLVSVKTTAQKSPATAVQKALTTYPGFQPSSKIKSQNDPRGLHGLLTAQLQQKKVSVKD